jgi:hypothetical protein
MPPFLSQGFVRWMAVALLVCSAGVVHAQEDAAPAPPPATPPKPTVEKLLSEAYEALTSAYYLHRKLEARFAVATNATDAVRKEHRARERASEIDALLRAEQQRLASTGIRMAVVGVTSARKLLPGMEIADGELGLALCPDAPKVLPVQVKVVPMEGVDGPAREVSVACDADFVIVGLGASPAGVTSYNGVIRTTYSVRAALMGDRFLHVRSSDSSGEGVWLGERQAQTRSVELERPGHGGPEEVRVDVPGLHSNGHGLQPMFIGDLNGDGRLDAVLRFPADVTNSETGNDWDIDGYMWRLVLSNGPGAPHSVAAWTLESRWGTEPRL